MAITTKGSRPLGVSVFSATPFETRLVKQTIKERFSKARIGKLVGDRAYDSDGLDKELKRKGIELIAPHKRNRKRKKTQDGRKLRPYKKRWTVERFFAWLQNFRRCLVRWERKQENFQAFIYLAAVIMLLRYF
jgi:transposase